MENFYVTLENTRLMQLVNRVLKRWFPSVNHYDTQDYRDLVNVKSRIVQGAELNAEIFKIVYHAVEYAAKGYSLTFLDPEKPYLLLPKEVTSYEPGTRTTTTRKGVSPLQGDIISTTEETVGEKHKTYTGYEFYINPITQNLTYLDLLRQLFEFSPSECGKNFIQGYPLEKFIDTVNALLDMQKILYNSRIDLIGEKTTKKIETDAGYTTYTSLEKASVNAIYRKKQTWYEDFILQTDETTYNPDFLWLPETKEKVHSGFNNFSNGQLNIQSRNLLNARLAVGISRGWDADKGDDVYDFYTDVWVARRLENSSLNVTHCNYESMEPFYLQGFIENVQGFAELYKETTLDTDGEHCYDAQFNDVPESSAQERVVHYSKNVTTNYDNFQDAGFHVSSIVEFNVNPQTCEISPQLACDFSTDPVSITLPLTRFATSIYLSGISDWENADTANVTNSRSIFATLRPIGCIITLNRDW